MQMRPKEKFTLNRRLGLALPIFTVILMLSRAALALGNSNNSECYSALTVINQYASAEPFESGGAFGLKIGLSVMESQPGLLDRHQPSAMDSAALNQNTKIPEQMNFPRLSVSKGTSWPVDVGLVISKVPKEQQTQLGGHLQWTIKEAFKKPTIAIRMSKIETTDIFQVSRIVTDTLQLGSSYAPFPYLTINASIGKQWHEWTVPTGINNTQESDSKHNNNLATIGLKIQPLTPYLNFNFEQTYLEKKQTTKTLKLSFLL